MSEQQSASDAKQQSHATTVPVFRIKPTNRSERAQIKHIGYLYDGQPLADEIVELDQRTDPLNQIPIRAIGSYQMTGHINRCNIVGSHIVGSKRYPLMYLDICYSRPLASGSLFQIFFSINIDRDEKRAVTDSRKYVDLRFSGKWYKHMDCDDELKDNYEQFVTELLENQALERLYRSDDRPAQSDDLALQAMRANATDTQIAEWVEQYVATERAEYDHMIADEPVRFVSVNRTRDYFVKLCGSEKFYNFLCMAIRAREMHRRSEQGLDDSSTYVVPSKITNMNTMMREMVESGELDLAM
jgi:hypothetical protein